MNIINKVHNEKFGELFCFADEEGNPCFWGKREKMKFLSKEEQELVIGLDIYCFDKNFNTKWEVEKADLIIRDIYEQYQLFLEDCLEIEDIFIREFNKEKDEWDIEESIETKEDLYSKIQVLKIDIVKEEYIINFLLDDEEWSLIKSCSKDTPSYFYINPTEEADFAEMDYR